MGKWRQLKYSRSERKKRAIQKQSKMCHTLDSFVVILHKMDILLKENYMLRKKLVGYLENAIPDRNENSIST